MQAKSLLPALVTTALLAFTLNAVADGGEEQDWQHEHDCRIHGHEVMDVVVALTATTNAPSNARGVAKIESENDGTNATATLELNLVGLDPGAYVLSVTRLSDGTNVILGQITIPIRNEEGDDDSEWDDHHRDGLLFRNWGISDHWIGWNWGGFTNWGSWTNWSVTNWCNISNRVTVTVTEAEVDLPADLNATDIGQIILSDTNGNAILVGDLVKPATNTVVNITATVQLIPGAAAPSAAGTAQLLSTTAKGKWKHQFILTASGLGAKSHFRVMVNDKKAGATRSNKSGQLTMKKLPSRLPAVRSLLLLDKKGNEAARVQF